jgi:uncharacterized protein YbjT (DUF2867 family)
MVVATAVVAISVAVPLAAGASANPAREYDARTMTVAHRSVLLAGATGLVGREMLRGLLADGNVDRVVVVGRRAPAEQNPKLQFHAVDFARIPALPPVDECYIGLGTTIKVAGSQAAFRAVDFDAVVNVAKAAKAAGATRLGVVSAMGASAKSGVFYSRVKGEMEDALAALGFDTLVIARPSMLAGDRAAAGQPVRGGEELALKVTRWFGSLIPRNYQSIAASSVAHALLHAVPASKGSRVMLSGELREY